MKSGSCTPFDQGRKAAQPDSLVENPHSEGSVEYRNFELGRQYGLRNLRAGAVRLSPSERV